MKKLFLDAKDAPALLGMERRRFRRLFIKTGVLRTFVFRRGKSGHCKQFFLVADVEKLRPQPPLDGDR